MPKDKKRDKSKSRKGGKKGLANGALLGTFAGGLVGKVVEKMLADAIEDFVRPAHHKHARRHAGKDGEDVAAKLLEALCARGPQSIPQILADTHLGLSPVLQALQTLRDFRLIHFVGDESDETVEVTRSGADVASVFRQNHIRDEAAKLLRA
jgi:hypothetical protein